MAIKKGQNNFKKIQDQKVRENTLKIENALSNLPKDIEKITLSKVVRLVAKETGLHFTTINKNAKYTEMCNEKYLSLKLSEIGNKSKGDSNEVRLLKHENTNLKNQIAILKKVIVNLENKLDEKA